MTYLARSISLQTALILQRPLRNENLVCIRLESAGIGILADL